MRIQQIKDTSSPYPYKYETHMHIAGISACARADAKAMANAYMDSGYTGVFVTDHNWGGNCAIDKNLPWKEFVSRFVQGYRDMKEEGDRIGLDVFFAWEAGYDATEFLIYGLSPEWLMEHEEIRTATVEKQFKLVKEAGGMVIHAHPFREETYIPEIRLFPQYVDGVEVINATHSNPKSTAHNEKKFDDLAIDYAKKYDFFVTAGSDQHTSDLFEGGMCFKRRIKDGQDFIKAVKNENYLLTNGVDKYLISN